MQKPQRGSYATGKRSAAYQVRAIDRVEAAPDTAITADSSDGRQSAMQELWRKYILTRTALVITVIVAAAIAGAVIVQGIVSSRVLPPEISRQITYGVYYPQGDVVSVDRSSIAFQADADLLTYKVALPEGGTLTVNQQPTPESFVDIPQAYDKLVTTLMPYASFDSLHGKVALTRPKELQGDQSAVMNAKGTLMFVRSSDQLSEDQWRRIFNSFEIIQSPAAK